MNVYVVNYDDYEVEMELNWEYNHKPYHVFTSEEKHTEEQFSQLVKKVVEQVEEAEDVFEQVKQHLVKEYGFVAIETIGADVTNQLLGKED